MGSKKQNSFGLLLFLLAMGIRTQRRTLTLIQLRQLATKHGFPNADLAAAVAMAESGGRIDAIGDYSSSFGLWQVHVPAHPEYTAFQLLDADNNARAALAISKGGLDWAPWTTFRTGAYKRWMGDGQS